MLPAFEVMQGDLATSMELVQMTVPVFIFGLAGSQLVFGPLSDRFGRRPVLISGMFLYLTGAVISATAGNIELVLLGRLLQGFGAGSGQTAGRAILRDTSSGPALARAVALAMSGFASGPIFAPLLGYGLTSLGDWRYVFIAMSLFSAFLICTALFWYKETNRFIDPLALKPARLARSFVAVFANWQSRTFLVLAVASHCALLSFITNAPRVYQSAFGVGGLDFAVMFAATGIGIVFGQTANRILLARFSILTILRGAALILLLVSAAVVITVRQEMLTAMLFTVLMFFFNTSFLVVISNSTSLIIDPHQNIAGTASAIIGFTTLLFSGLFTFITLPVFEGDIGSWAIGMVATTGVTFFGLLTVRRERLTFDRV